ncbi:kinase-like protein [Aaosphaeria arxii CBS 175.79]|uniref:Kinase-like protein n=1 Tax=Aaosphaeria arxii CBS 175.79 TaxID=1450172 RepID=A0A6A5Y4P0_9PLEO|nr:kinase-like protein [Aaosphaeria arxii CBS 175.79]KAF2020522.1 kinase-like protein [Aaosphaeria arxii CBS 175.79]
MPSSSCNNITIPKDGKYHVDPSNPMHMVRYLEAWYPPGVSEKDFLWGGNTAQLALLADNTVLKYAWDRDDGRAKNCLEVEHSILSALGDHERIIKYLGKHEYGLRFKFAANGDVRRYLTSRNPSESSEQLRRKWAKQAAEAVAFIHSEGVIHCDIHPNNFLLDENLDIQLCDFAGSVFGHLDGGAMESIRFFLPRDPMTTPDIKSDLFALGSTIYFLMSDREPYSNLIEEEVTARYSRMEFPDIRRYPCGRVIEACWKGDYRSAQEVVESILALSD